MQNKIQVNNTFYLESYVVLPEYIMICLFFFFNNALAKSRNAISILQKRNWGTEKLNDFPEAIWDVSSNAKNDIVS